MAIALSLHLLAAIVWVGGMFFAHMALRPALTILEPQQRLPLMLKVFDHFFPWVWAAVIILLVTGFWLFYEVLFGMGGVYMRIMAGVGSLMALIFVYIYFGPYQQMSRAIGRGDMPAAAQALSVIRPLILTNLLLGLAISALIIVARYGLA